MSQAAIVHTDAKESQEAGRVLGADVREALGGHPPDALIVFASSRYDYRQLLRALDTTCRPRVLMGCSSAGEFTSDEPRQSSACAVALRAPESELNFAVGLGRNLRIDRAGAARDLVSSFSGPTTQDYSYRSAMILTDALAGHADDLVAQITFLTGGTYQLFGGGAGDDANFHQTHVFFGTEAFEDAAVGLEILSNKPLGVGVCHGWLPASALMRVTEAEGMRLVSLDSVLAVEVFEEHALRTGQVFDRNDPLPFFLHNVLGVQVGEDFRLRVPLVLNGDGSVSCAAEIPLGSTVALMKATGASAARAATEAARAALNQLGDASPKVAIFFDCVATRLRTGREFGLELVALREAMGSARFAGCNSYGQIARAEEQFSGFHNCTAVIGVFPE